MTHRNNFTAGRVYADVPEKSAEGIIWRNHSSHPTYYQCD